MAELVKIADAFHKLNFILSKEQKKYSVLVMIMALISAVLEMLGVSIIVPLLDAFLEPDALLKKSYVQPFAEMLGLQETTEVIIVICIVMIALYVFKNIYNTFYCWASGKFSCKVMRELSVHIMSAYMKQGYEFFVKNNSAQLIRGIGNDVNSIYTIMTQLITLFSKLLTLISIAVLIIVVTPRLSLLLLGIVIFCFALTQLIFRKPMKQYGESARYYQYKCYQVSLEAIQGSKEVLVTNRQKYFIKEYEKDMREYNKADLRRLIGAATPAYLIEMVCVTGLMLAVIFQMLQKSDAFTLLSQLSVLAIAAFRILPSLGAILSAVNVIAYNAPALTAAYDTFSMVKNLEKEKALKNTKEKQTQNLAISFKDKITLSHITFSYQNGDNRDTKVLDDLNMEIKKGKAVAFIGASGAGKTTLADVILGLFKPQQGEVLMDNVNIEDMGEGWHQIIGYVPQSIYMTDTTIRQNIAFGVAEKEIDDNRVWEALEMAQLKEFVEGLPEQLSTRVGEWGVQFSGGQRQRVAIARALYGNPDILILDEATAALDTETETAVMEAIDALQGVKTLIIVAHRLTTIRNCDEIYRIEGGKAIYTHKEEIF